MNHGSRSCLKTVVALGWLHIWSFVRGKREGRGLGAAGAGAIVAVIIARAANNRLQVRVEGGDLKRISLFLVRDRDQVVPGRHERLLSDELKLLLFWHL